MRWNQISPILNESLSKYRPMFTALYPNGKVPREVEMFIQKIERVMKREDRVVWALRWYRMGLVMEMVGSSMSMDRTPEQEKMIQKAKRDLTAKGTSISDSDAINGSDEVYNNLNEFEHYFSLEIHEIDRYVFDRQTPNEIFQKFADYEQEWKDELDNNESAIETGGYGDELLIDFHNGWAWWHLDRSHCRIEGDAMGHCGNSASYKSDDTLLSLRQKIRGDHWEPHLTFILDGNGYLGEMKGKGNEKPVERYHSMIKALLLNPIVKGIKGGGYAPENNFSLSDLPDADQEEVKAAKPGMRSLSELLADGDDKAVEMLIKEKMHSRGWSYEKIVIEGSTTYLVLNHWNTVEQFCNRNVEDYNETFNEIRDTLESQYPEDASVVYEKFYDDYYVQTLRDHIYDFNDYKADIGFDWPSSPGGRVEMTISLNSLEDCFDGDPDYGSPQIEYDLDETNDYNSYGDRDPSFDDSITEELCDYVGGKSKTGRSMSELAANIHGQYAGTSKYSNGSPTVNHPDQYNFKF